MTAPAPARTAPALPPASLTPAPLAPASLAPASLTPVLLTPVLLTPASLTPASLTGVALTGAALTSASSPAPPTRSSRTMVALVITALALGALSCATPPHTPDPEPDLKDQGASAPDQGGPPEWDCQGNLVPPTGWEQETAFESASTPNAVQAATDAARRKLLDRLCGGGSNCDALDARIRPWKTGQGARDACVMVVIEAADLDEWRRQSTSLDGLDQSLGRAAAELLEGRKAPSVAIDKIIDSGAAGGDRAEWLEGRMARALRQAGGAVREIPRAWDGRDLPPGVDVVVSAVAAPRAEQQRAVIEVIWSARVRGPRGVEIVTAAALNFPADAAPSTGAVAAALPPSDPDLSVRLEAQRGGSLCLGERTQLWLASKHEAHVRVFDLYGDRGALLLFPNEDHPDDRVRAGESIALGGDLGFEAIPAPGSEVERFLVIASPSPKGLGRFEAMSGYCRVPEEVAARLHRGESIPSGARAASDSFRLIARDNCPSAPTLADRQGQARALDSLPVCK